MCFMDKKNMCDAKVSPVRPDTSSSYLRKIKKPLIERKRRERINTCLTQLKSILLDNIKQNGGTQVSKLDKADILEMTVSHLRQIHHQQLSAAMATSSSVVTQFREGFAECATETVRYMEASRAYPTDMVMRVHNNLANKMGVNRDLHSAHARYPYTGSAYNAITSRDCTPVKVKVESVASPNNRSLSPDSGFDSAFSPLLMTVPSASLIKREPIRHTKNISFSSGSDSSMLETSAEMCSTSDSANASLNSSTEQSTSASDNSGCKSPTSGSAQTSRQAANGAAESPSQKNVWRPF